MHADIFDDELDVIIEFHLYFLAATDPLGAMRRHAQPTVFLIVDAVF